MNYITNNEDLNLKLELDGYVINPEKIKLIDIAIYTDNVYAGIRKTHEDVDSLNCVKITSNELSSLSDGIIHYNIQVVEKEGNTFADVVTTDYELQKDEGGGSIYDAFVKREELDNYVTNDSLNEKGFLTEHQPLDHLATKDEVKIKADKAELATKLEKEDADKLYQPVGEYLTKHQDISHLAEKKDIPTKVSDLRNDAGYISNIPTNYITEEKLAEKHFITEHQSIDHLASKKEIEGVAKEDWVNNQINNKIIETKVNLDDYYKKSETYSKKEVDEKGYLTQHQSISHLANKNEIPTKLSELLNDVNFISQHQSIDHKADKEDVYTKDEIDKKHFISEHQDISHLASKEDLPSLVSQLTNDAGYLTKVPSEYVTDLTLSEYGTKVWINSQIDKKVAEAPKVDLSNYYKKSETYSQDEIDKKHFLTQHQNISHLANKNELPKRLSELYNDCNFLTEHQSLEDYATLVDVNKKADIDHKHSEYLTQADINDKLDKHTAEITYQPKGNYATIEELDARQYLTEIPSEYVTDEELEKKQYLTEHQSIDHLASKDELLGYQLKGDYVTNEELAEKGFVSDISDLATKLELENYQLKGDYVTNEELAEKGFVSDVTGLATKKELENYQLKGNYITNAELENKGYIDNISHLATRAELAGYQPRGNYADKEWVNARIDLIETPQPVDLSEYYKKYETYSKCEIDAKDFVTDDILTLHYATKEYVDDKIASSGGGGGIIVPDLKDYYKKSETYSRQEIDEKGFLTEHQTLKTINGQSLIGNGDIIIEGGGTGGTVDLSNYYKKSETYSRDEVNGLIPNLDNYITNEVLNSKGYLTQIPSEYITESELEDKHYLTQHQDITGKLDVSGYTEDKKTFALKTDLEKYQIAGDYVTNDALDKKGYLTEHQDITGKLDVAVYNQDKPKFALKTDLESYQIAGDYVTNDALNQKGYLTQIPSEYITETELEDKHYLTQHQNLDHKLDKSIYESDKPTFALKSELTKVDAELSLESTNPVQNKAVSKELNEKVESVVLTQKEYDELPIKDAKTMYVISDALKPEDKFYTKDQINRMFDDKIGNVDKLIMQISNKI